MKTDDLILNIFEVLSENKDYFIKNIAEYPNDKVVNDFYNEIFYYIIEYLKKDKLYKENIDRSFETVSNLSQMSKIIKKKVIDFEKYMLDKKNKEFDKLADNLFKDNYTNPQNLKDEREDIFKNMIESYFNNTSGCIMSILVSYITKILFDDYLKEKIDDKLGFKFTCDGMNKKDFESYFDVVPQEKVITKNNKYYDLRSHYSMFIITILKYKILSDLYNKLGEGAFKRAIIINKKLEDVYEHLESYRGVNRIDLFEGLYTYDELALQKQVNFNNDNISKPIIEIADENGMFKGLNTNEIAYILYSYLEKYKTINNLVSNNKDYAFKDLTPLVELIKRRKKEGYDWSLIKKLIDDVASGKINIKFEDKERDNIILL